MISTYVNNTLLTVGDIVSSNGSPPMTVIKVMEIGDKVFLRLDDEITTVDVLASTCILENEVNMSDVN